MIWFDHMTNERLIAGWTGHMSMWRMKFCWKGTCFTFWMRWRLADFQLYNSLRPKISIFQRLRVEWRLSFLFHDVTLSFIDGIHFSHDLDFISQFPSLFSLVPKEINNILHFQRVLLAGSARVDGYKWWLVVNRLMKQQTIPAATSIANRFRCWILYALSPLRSCRSYQLSKNPRIRVIHWLIYLDWRVVTEAFHW
jgi:hypothetical protein